MSDEMPVIRVDTEEIERWWQRLKDERDQPRSPSLADVLAKLQEIEEKIDILLGQIDLGRKTMPL